jgi:hypothetical protein
MNSEGITTNDVIKWACNELQLLMAKKITPVRANASARLVMGVAEMAQLEVQHHRLRPARGNAVRPVMLVRPEAKEVPLLEDKGKKRRK